MSTPSYPVVVVGRLEPNLSRWLWLVKWFLLIPHAIILFFLWMAFAVLSVIAWFAILFTGRYPRSLFDFNLGVMRWSWRVGYYSYSALGTDRYPPFTLGEVPDYPARLDVAYPERLSRGLVLVKSWLLAVPHYLVLAFLTGGGLYAAGREGDQGWRWGGGVVALLVLFAAIVLLVRGRYPQGIFDLVMGINRWSLRVLAYAALMTDQYPPFRLDQGGEEPAVPPSVPPGAGAPAGAAVDTPAEGSSPAGPSPRTPSGWRPLRVVGVIFGSLGVVSGLAFGLAGGAMLYADKQLRDDDGFVMTDGQRFETASYAVTTRDVDLQGGAAIRNIVGDVKIRVEGSSVPAFIGVARTADVQAHLNGVRHAVARDLNGAGDPIYRDVAGGSPTQPPTQQDFWVAQASGSGTRTLRWNPDSGHWTAVLMNADGSAGVSAEVSAGATAPVLGWGSATLLVLAGVSVGGGLVLLVVSIPRGGSHRPGEPVEPAGSVPATQQPRNPAGV